MNNQQESKNIKLNNSDFSFLTNQKPWLKIPADGSPLTFTGNADEAAKEFFNALIRVRDGYISALKAERDALAVENQALKDSNRKLINEQQASWPIGLLDSFIAEHDPKTPATSAALAAIRNEATARALKHLCDCQLISATVAELKATELREGK
ncbi:hypothetical protein [Serratia sp. CY56464]|uniref:hypothetical protein n=1 Tax=Serratia sp. CY56464 TaxID=3383641 RepID=UPI003FA12056